MSESAESARKSPAATLLLLELNTAAALLRCQLQVLLRLELVRCFTSEQCDMDQMVEEVSSSSFVHINTFCPIVTNHLT